MGLAGGMIAGVLSVVMAVILVVNVVVPTVKDANTTSFTASELAIYGLITLVAIFGLIFSVGSVFGVF